jgi:indole-3-acetate monooxygenase
MTVPIGRRMSSQRLSSLVVASREEGERIRRVPSHVVEALAAAGLLQMFLPRSMGGPELDPLAVFRAIEEISKADGSVGWCTMIATDVSLLMGWLPADIGREFCRQPADFRGAGSLRPLAQLRRFDPPFRDFRRVSH